MTNLPFVEGFMPLQMLLELAGLGLVLSVLSFLLGRAGHPVNRFSKALILFFTIVFYLKFRVYPPMPFSVLAIYSFVALIAILLWASSSEQYWQEFQQPIINVLDGITPLHKGLRAFFLVAIPVCAWGFAYESFVPWASRDVDDPVELRTVMPAPPRWFTIHGKRFEYPIMQNPYRVNRQGIYDFKYTRELGVEWSMGRIMKPHANPWEPKGDPYLTAIREGGRIYFQECILCHGANLNARGIFSPAFNPIPTNFTDPGTIAQIQEIYAFWRTASGGISLPKEGFPWASTQPRMEEHLSTDDIWKVVLFTYWHTGWEPRTWD